MELTYTGDTGIGEQFSPEFETLLSFTPQMAVAPMPDMLAIVDGIADLNRAIRMLVEQQTALEIRIEELESNPLIALGKVCQRVWRWLTQPL